MFNKLNFLYHIGIKTGNQITKSKFELESTNPNSYYRVIILDVCV